MKRTFAVCVLAAFNVVAVADDLPTAPANLDFEEGELGQTPTGWLVPQPSVDAGYRVYLSGDKPKAGKRCAVISRSGNDEPKGFGNIMQSFDAAKYRGQRVRFKAAVRADVAGEAKAMLWLRVDRKDEKPGFFDNMADRPITKKDWNDYEIVGDVADDAETINIGLMLVGNGKAGLDAASFEMIGKIGEGNDPPRGLKDRGLENLVAYTKLLGYVRYFHPSDEAADANWDKFAIDGIPAVEGAKNAEELAASLQKLFLPVAPTLQVFVTGKSPAPVPPAKGTKIIAWYHYGVGTGNGSSIYSSKRVDEKAQVLQAFGTRSATKLPDPAQPFTADLGGGVSCSVPLSLPADGTGTLPKAKAKAAASTKPSGFAPNGNDRASRLAAVMLAWNIFQHFYPYFDVVKTDWPSELKLALAAAATDKDDRAFLDTLRRLVAALQDGHGSVYMKNSEMNGQLPLSWDWIEDRLVVTRVPPKLAEDLKAGDVILRINGRTVASLITEQEKLISGATPQWKRWRALQLLKEGPKDSEASLAVQRRAGVVKTVKVTHDPEGVEPDDIAEQRPAKVEEIQNGVMYVDIDRITDKDFQDAIPQLEKAKGIIFDLRGYPKASFEAIGHLTDKLVTCAQWHIPTTLYPDRQNVAFHFSNWTIAPKKPRFQAKIAFLTDGRAISAAETYMGIIEHYKLAAIVGSPTAGTNGNVNPFTLPGGYSISWTGMKVLKHDGSQHHGIGIQPTVPVSRTIKGVAAGKDEVLDKAIEIVRP
jgi:C-terminal processing protease CtpA/Prc